MEIKKTKWSQININYDSNGIKFYMIIVAATHSSH